MWLIAAVIAVLTVAAVVVLWWPATAGLNGPDLVSARLDALKVGLSVAVGSGGAVALYLSWRRQDSAERTLAHQEHDSAERRLTELYLKAVEQLGSPQAAVRHGGLYALERVAQDNSHQRQTVVNVICAYLRNPYVPPSETGQPRPLGIRRPLVQSVTATRSAPTPSLDGGREALLQEREVRLTAQRILQLHLHAGPDPDLPIPSFWHDIYLDLTGAILINFSLQACALATATFDGATFTGYAQFDRATFTGDAGFGDATFTGHAQFDRATFTGDAGFGGATFYGDARFGDATFTGHAQFDRATFTRYAGFGDATFTGDSQFNRATFTRYAKFGGATFYGDARFTRATFAGDAGFGDATFYGDARFGDATFAGHAEFGGATFESYAGFVGAAFTRDPGSVGATFRDYAPFGGANFTGDAKLNEALRTTSAWLDEAIREVRSSDPTAHDALPPDETPPSSEGSAP